MKHLELDFHFVREKVSVGLLQVLHVSSLDQLADLLTKPLSRARFLLLRDKLCTITDSTGLWGRVEPMRPSLPPTVESATDSTTNTDLNSAELVVSEDLCKS